MKTKYTVENHNQWLNDILLEASDKLNDWEIGFLDNIELQLNLKIPLSLAQEQKLEQIYAKHTS